MHTIRYKSFRSEIWWWYWQSWANRLWQTHIFLSVIISTVIWVSLRPMFSLKQFVDIFLGTLVVIVFVLALFPQVRFKKQERSLTINDQGISTEIGKLSGNILWNEVKSITEKNNYIIITRRNGNAMLIPPRAFADGTEKEGFLADMNIWFSASKTSGK